MIDLTPILQAIIAFIASIFTVVIIPYIKSKKNNEQLSELESWVSIAVTAAEQIYKGYGRGKEKKEYVIQFLLGKGFKVDEDLLIGTIDTLIEAAVYELKK